MLKSRTMLFAVALAVLSVAQGYVVRWELDPTTEMLVGCAIAAAVAVLRTITTQPLAER